MAVTSAQEAAFTGGTLGVPMESFQLTILLVFYALLYTWATWVIFTQWQAWCRRRIDFYAFLTRCVRSVLITLVAGFFLT